MMMLRSILLATAWITTSLLALAEEGPPALPKKPPWQLALSADDAKRAETLQTRIAQSQVSDKYEDAVRFGEELLALQQAGLGEDHHQTIDTRLAVAGFKKIVKLPAERRREWQADLRTANEALKLERGGKFSQSLPLRQAYLQACLAVLGEDHPSTASSYSTVAYDLYSLGKSAEAQVFFQKSLDIRRRILGEFHPETATAYGNLAMNLKTQGKIAEALPLLQKALASYRKALGDEHEATATGYNNLGITLDALGKHAEAQALLEKALAIKRKTAGEAHDSTANSYGTVASNLNAQGKFAQAQPHYEQCLKIYRQLHGENHPSTAFAYSNVAFNLESLARYSEAQALSQKSLDIYRQVFGEDHPATARSYNNLGFYLKAQAKDAEAHTLFLRALEIRRKVLGEDHPDTATSYNNVAFNLDAMGKYSEAQPFYRKSLAIYRRLFGETHPFTANCYNNMASNLQAQGKPLDAQPLYEAALAIRRKALGEEHPDTGASLNNLAILLTGLKKYAAAQPLYEKFLAINQSVYGENHPTTAHGYNNLAFNLDSQGKHQAARPHYERARGIRLQVLGENHPETASSYNNLAMNLSFLGEGVAAQPLFEKALEIRRRVLGEGHPDTARTYMNLAFSLYGQHKPEQTESYLQAAISSFESSRLAGAAGLDRASLTYFDPRLLLAAIQHAKDPAAAWATAELSLARGLLDQQASARVAPLTDLEREAQRADRSLLAALQPRILALLTKADPTAEDSANLDTLRKQRRQAEERLASLATAVSQREVLPPAKIRAALPANAALLFWVDVGSATGNTDEHLACVVRAEGEPKWERLPGTGPGGKWLPADLSLSKNLYDALAQSSTPAEIDSLVKRLHAQRIAPVIEHLAGVKTLYVVPVNEMAGVPVEVLAPAFVVSYVPSGTFLARTKGQSPFVDQKLLAVGDPIFNGQEGKPVAEKNLPPGGLLVSKVFPESVAAKGNLAPGDVLLKYGEVDLANVDLLKAAIVQYQQEKTVTVTVWRETSDKQITQELTTGSLGVAVDPQAAPVALAARRKADALLLAARGGNWKELPGTRLETNRLRQLLGEQCRVLTDGEASEERLEELRKSGELATYRYLHFATHGEGNTSRAFESTLILSQDKSPQESQAKAGEPFIDGHLTAGEVLEFWKLNCDLVTLSACETAFGTPGGGDGLLGFAQAFLSAGSRSVCLSLWKVDDAATSLLMDRFYQNLLGKRDGLAKPLGKAAALDEAKRWLRNLSREEALQHSAALSKGVVRGTRGKDEELQLALPTADPKTPALKDSKPFAHPQYWAAFILIGDPN